MTDSERIRFKFTSDYPLKYGANAAAEFDNPDWPRFVRITDVTANGNLREDTFRSLPPAVASGYELEEGDILLARSGATVGKTFIYEPSWGEACYAGYLIRSRTSAAYWPKFVYWYCQSAEYWAEIQSNLIQATIQNFNAEKYANIKMPSPPLETQKRIAAFLDEKTAQIDGLIEKKRALLDRLAEKRQAIITQAVTKGLNPSALMKDSGINRLGDIPAHWEVKRLKFVTERPLKYGANAPADWDEPSWPRFVRITDVAPSGALRPETFRSLPPEIGSSYALADGDILLARSGATVGKSFLYRPEWGNACFAGYLIQARISTDHDAEFMYQYLNSDSFWSWVSANFIQSTIQNISAEKYAGIWMPCPPLDEQVQIVEQIANVARQVSVQVDWVRCSLEKLTEYRSALITAAVTGQIEGLR